MKQLTKARFVAGCDCLDLLWWKVNEPDADELVPDLTLQDRFEQGRAVGERARQSFPGGTLIAPGQPYDARLGETRQALANGAPAVFEACFVADDTFVAVDVLERDDGGFRLVEVKSTTSVKGEHIPDVALQVHVLRACGINVVGAEVMHLNKECRYPDLDDLFVRCDVLPDVEIYLPEIPAAIEQQLEVINGEFQDVGFGEHCLSMKDCAFRDRCWPEVTADHVLTLYRLSADKKWALIEDGVESIADIEDSSGLGKPAQRQVRSVKQNALIIGPGLDKQLGRFSGRLGFLDFETVSLAIPVWNGLGPWAPMVVQFSCHVEKPDGSLDHHEFIAESGDDCREAMGLKLVEICRDVDVIVAYKASFEKRCLTTIGDGVPSIADDMASIAAKLVDPLPVIRDFVYHPNFMGSFSLKTVLPALLPELGYDDLEVGDGMTASLLLKRLLFHPDQMTEKERRELREDLRKYCERDTWATVCLVKKLKELAKETS